MDARKATRFNRACAVSAVLWLTVGPLLSQALRFNYFDFGQFYMGGLIAREGAWDALYPVPRPGHAHNPGGIDASDMRPRYEELSRQYGVGDTVRFMQLPPNALLYAPLSLVSYPHAHVAWLVLMGLGAGGTAVLAGRIFRRLSGKPGWMEGVVVLAVGLSPTLFEGVRVGQISPVLGLLIGLLVLDLIGARDARASVWMFFGALSKYITGALFPLAIAMRRWRLVVWLGVWTVVGAAVSLLVIGTGPFIVFFREISPLLGRSHGWAGNQSISALVIRATGREPLPAGMAVAVTILQCIVLAWLLVVILRRKVEFWRNPAHVLAAAAALLCWMLIFSPIFWDHYHAYLMPLWGWLAWEATQSRRRAIVAIAAIALAWCPVAAKLPRLPEPLLSHMLISAVLIFSLAVVRLANRPAN